MTKTVRAFSREFKEAAVLRMLAGENVSALGRELQVRRKLLYAWRASFRAEGPQGLRPKGRPRRPALGEGPPPPLRVPEGSTAELEQALGRVAELERKVGQQELELDFFRGALRQLREPRRPSDGLGVKSSSNGSGR